MESLIIREAIAADIPALAQLHVTTWNATYAPMLMNGAASEAVGRGDSSRRADERFFSGELELELVA